MSRQMVLLQPIPAAPRRALLGRHPGHCWTDTPGTTGPSTRADSPGTAGRHPGNCWAVTPGRQAGKVGVF
ncbi:unnamed protein product [Merluccius merluccius]